MTKNFNQRRVGTIDLDTGEHLEGNMVGFPKKRNPYREGWIQVSLDGIAMLIEAESLTMESLLVFLVVLENLDYENVLTCSQVYIAKRLGISGTQVSRSFKKLLKESILFKEKTSKGLTRYLVNPDFCWRGKEYNLRKFRRENPSYLALAQLKPENNNHSHLMSGKISG